MSTEPSALFQPGRLPRMLPYSTALVPLVRVAALLVPRERGRAPDRAPITVQATNYGRRAAPRPRTVLGTLIDLLI